MAERLDPGVSHLNNRPLKIGLFLPIGEAMMGGDTAGWADLLALARRAEAVGFDSLWVPDHILMRFPDQEGAMGGWECWSLLAALAAATTRVELAPLVTCANYRNPALLAKMADTVDEISGGRLILGLGAGWHEPEFQAFGFPYDHRVSRFAEAINIIATLLRDGGVDYEGRFYAARNCELRPRGPRRHGPPLLVGTSGPRMLRLTARYADLWNAEWVNEPKALPPASATVDAACAEVGRDPATLGRTASVMLTLPGHGRPGEYWVADAFAGRAATGSPEEVAALFHAYAAEGISHVQLWLDPSTERGIETFAPVLELLDRG
ncbi:MAG: LLM class flavin-dependent oxidoreductase [Chloroflexia bacterium]|nr:LLM class flavin-dependent oxidoreductase [Chloroflexia bacterium]MBA3644285.1 LLM class flavin-dependent oxidoreductase [Chloroflexia bacterium]